MVVRFLSWLAGRVDYSVGDGTANDAARLLILSGARFRDLRRDGQGLTFSLPLSQSAVIERVFDEHGIPLRRTAEHGLARILRRYRHRYGIPVGIAVFFLILFLSGRFVWSIGVSGNEMLSEREILETLDGLGCGIGSYIPSLDIEGVEEGLLAANREIAWAAVNLRGTRAVVEIREVERAAPVPDEDTPYNVIAAEDGIVRRMELYRGAGEVQEGDLFFKGDMLASGVVETKAGLRLVHARGKVIAEVERDIRVEIPLEREVKRATGRVFREKSLKILGFTINFFRNTGNLPPSCDRIDREVDLRLFDAVELPIKYRETVYSEYAYETVTVDEETARTEAYREFRRRCEEELRGNELVSRDISAGMVDGVYVIDCRLSLLTDIAREVEIYR